MAHCRSRPGFRKVDGLAPATGERGVPPGRPEPATVLAAWVSGEREHPTRGWLGLSPGWNRFGNHVDRVRRRPHHGVRRGV
ncbi:hypothetical protein FRAHR75_40119 [Frankia sp. Hr75.2]|nr:hypothetical protein FRAHR75_40119 [Frankia sp. Hr75.2]